ncbi:YDG domain-containing protein, partial [Collimonas sp.]|uniref:YDG domain-containing protein n=1 Tax=Collimonas sp. TaxID=1963772 RepID=UPI0037C03B53
PTQAQVNSYDPSGTLSLTAVPGGGGTATFTGHLGRPDGEDVGTYAIGLGSLSESNYTINYTAADLTINKSSNPALALQAQADAQTKIYGQADPALSYQIGNPSVFVNRTVQSYDPNGNLHGVTLTDNAATALTGGLARLSSEDVGTYGINQGSLSAANYVLNYSPANFTITPAPLTIAGLIAQNKVYDTTTLAQISGGALTGVLASDSGNVSLSGSVVGNLSDKNVGNNKNVIVSNGGLSGSRAFNYYIDYIATGTTGNITPAPLRISGVRPQDRVYDGTTNATFIGTPALSGVYASDIGSVSIPIQNVVGNFADKNAGVNKQVISNPAAAVLSGSEAGNYQIVGIDASVNSATISPAALLLSAVSTTKLFDGTRDCDGVVTVKGLVGGDTITNLNLHQVYNSPPPRGKNRSTLSAAGDYQINDGNNDGDYVAALLSAPGTIKPYPGTPNFGQDLVSASVLPDGISTRSVSEDILQKMGQGNWLLNFDPRDIKSKSFHESADSFVFWEKS